MEKKRVVPIWVSVVLAALLIAGLILGLIPVFTSLSTFFNDLGFTVRILDTIGGIVALIYCFKGYQKNAAAYFKAFCITYCLSNILALYFLAGAYQAGSFVYALIYVLHLISFACMSIFVGAKDIGKKRSTVLSLIILACTLINSLTVINSSFVILIGLIESTIASIVFCIMVYAKYKDKEARGTK